MRNLSDIGRIFYGIAIGGMGGQMIYYDHFPYMLIPPKHSGIPGIEILTYISGALLILVALGILFGIKTRTITLFLGIALLLIFCFYFVPYEFFYTSDYSHFIEWDNALKEMALSCGAFIIAGNSSKTNENSVTRFLSRLIPLGTILYPLIIASFGTLHFLYAEGVAEYAPSWLPNRILWIYLAGAGLLGCGLAIFLKIKVQLFATLLGSMILIWFIILHIPKVIATTGGEREGEITSAFLALAYSGTAFVISGMAKWNNQVR